MVKEPINKTFGGYLAYFRNQTKSENGKQLTQEKMAEAMSLYPGIVVSPDQIYKWENGKKQIRPSDRDILIVIIKVLVDYGGIKSVIEANVCLKAGGLKNLEDSEINVINFPNLLQNYVDYFKLESTKRLEDRGEKPYVSGGGKDHASDPMNNLRIDQFYYRKPHIIDGSTENFIQESKGHYQTSNIQNHPGLVPALPAILLGRGKDLAELKNRLNISRSEENSNIQVITAIRGWPGVGATTIAAALAYEPEVIDQYPDGTLWISLDANPNIMGSLNFWGDSLGIQEIHKARSISEASGMLSADMQEKHMLVIIDDVWNAADALPFIVGGHGCGTLITTRLPVIASKIVPSPEQIYLLGVLADQDAFKLLQKLAPQVVQDHPEETKLLVRKLEGLPLALQIAGRLLQTEYSSGFSVNDLIKEISSGKRLLGENVPIGAESLTNITTPCIAALLFKSLDHLDARTRDCYSLLGVFAPSPAKFDQTIIGSIWQTNDPKPMIKTLVDRGLLEYLPQSKQYQIHSLLVMLAKSLWTNGKKSSQFPTK